MTFALASDDMTTDLASAAAIGSPLDGPIDGERRRSDGEVVRWTLAMPPTVGPDEPPFLIQHDLTGAEWRPDRAERGSLLHPLGGTLRVTALTIDVADPAVRGGLSIHARLAPEGIRWRRHPLGVGA